MASRQGTETILRFHVLSRDTRPDARAAFDHWLSRREAGIFVTVHTAIHSARKLATIALLSITGATSRSGRVLPAPPIPAYEVYAVRFASYAAYPTRGLIVGADTSRRSDLAFTVWLLRGGGRTVLVDAGFYRDKFLQRWKPVGFARPSDALASLGVKPDDVTDIVISHVHWDHLDGADLFPRARVWLQRDEFEHHTNDSGAVLDRAIDAEDAKMLAVLKAAGRLQLVPGDSVEILPGITVYTGGKHTFASQYVGVNATLSGGRTGTVILASDNAYLYENLERRRPIGQTLDSLSNLRAQERMMRLASAARLVVPGHDVDVFTRFPKPGNGVARIE